MYHHTMAAPTMTIAPEFDAAHQFTHQSRHSPSDSVLTHRAKALVKAHVSDESGMSTIEYALGCVAAAALGALLYTVVTSDTVEQALTGIFSRALNQKN